MTESQVFLSYALDDTGTACHVARAIERRGWALSWERYEDPDAVTALALRESLAVADCVVVLWSRHSVGSAVVQDEASFARARGNLVQAALDDADIPMPFVLDEPTRLSDAWSVRTLVEQIARILEGGPEAPVPEAPGEDTRAAQLNAAERCADEGRLEEAIELYEHCLADEGAGMKAVRRLGDLYLAADREEDAARQYARVAEHLAESGFTLPAIETYHRVVELVPHRAGYRERLAALVRENERKRETAPLSRVQYTVTAPRYARAGESFAVELWLHEDDARGEIRGRLDQPAPEARSGALSARLHIDGLEAEEPEGGVGWDRGIGRGSFHVVAPVGAALGGRRGTLSVYSRGLQVARVHFLVQLGEVNAPREIVPSRLERVRRAYAAFAPEDRERVRRRISELETAAPEIDVTLDSGDFSHFLDVLPDCDVFYLFWSQSARTSRDLQRQWRYALRFRGVAAIDPVPLDPPPLAPPPPELAMLHGGDWQSRYERAAEAFGAAPGPVLG